MFIATFFYSREHASNGGTPLHHLLGLQVEAYRGKYVKLFYRNGEPLRLNLLQISEIGIILGEIAHKYRNHKCFNERISGRVYVRWDGAPEFPGIHIRHRRGRPGIYVFPDEWYPLMDALRGIITDNDI